MPSLSIEKRDITITPEVLRKNDKIPAVLYGRKEPSTPITLSRKEFEKVWREAGESTVITLQGVDEDKQALIHEVSIDPVTDGLLHVDFYVVEKGMKVTTHVPLQFIGEAPAVKNLGGTLVKVMHELEVEALPKDLPHEITIDVGVLETFDSFIAIKDIVLGEGVTIHGDPDERIAAVAEPQREEEPVTTEIDMDSIEVEKKGKKEEEIVEEEAA